MVLVSGDKDLLQVVGDRIVVRDTMRDRTWGPPEIQERYGLAPGQIPDLLALMGDSVDNIPGIPGVGEKTARDLLQRFGSLEAAIQRAAEIPRVKLREAVHASAEQARMSKRLATVQTDLALPWAPGDLRRKGPNIPGLLDLCRELGFSRLAQQFSQPELA